MSRIFRIRLLTLVGIWPSAAYASTSDGGGAIILFGGISIILGAMAGTLSALTKSKIENWIVAAAIMDIFLCFALMVQSYGISGGRETALENILCAVIFVPASIYVSRKIVQALMQPKKNDGE